MPRRLRKLIGTVVMIAFVAIYALFAMALADSRVSEAPEYVRAVVYAVLGLAWVLPLMPLIRWMERPDADPPVEPGRPTDPDAAAPAASKGSVMKYLALFVLLAFPAAALAQPAPKSIADCEKIKGDLAYNQCLSMFGPKVGERRSRGVAPADDGDEPAVAQGRRGRYGYARRGGRQRASFEIGARRSSLRVSPAWQGRAARSRRR